MKKSLVIKVLLSILVFIIMGIGVLMYYVSTKISPEDIRQQIIAQLHKTLPHMQVEIKSIEYSLGLSIDLKINEWKMQVAKDSKGTHSPTGDLLEVHEMELRVPLWSILTQGGEIDLLVKNPLLNFMGMPGGKSNWTLALKTENVVESAPSAVQTSGTNEQSESHKWIEGFVSRSRMNVKITDLLLNYKLDQGQSGQVTLSRFLIKNINLTQPTAFELASHLALQVNPQNKLECEALVIGQLNLDEFVKGKDVAANLVVTIDQIQYPLFKNSLGPIKTDLDLQLSRDNKKITVKINSDLAQFGMVKMLVEMINENIKISQLDVQLAIKEIWQAFATPELSNKMQLDGNAKFQVQGQVEMEKGSITPHLAMQTTSEVTIQNTAPYSLNVKGQFSGNIDGDKFNATLHSALLGGNLDVDLKTILNVNHLEKNAPLTQTVNVSIVGQNFKVEKAFLRSFLYSNKTEEGEGTKSTGVAGTQTESGHSQSENTSANEEKGVTKQGNKMPPMLISLKLNNISIAEEHFELASTIAVKDEQVATDDLRFQFAKGQGKLIMSAKMPTENAMDVNLDFLLTNLNLDSLNVFLPAQIEKVSGVFTGKVKGNVSQRATKLNFLLNTDLVAKNGEIKGIELKEIVMSALSGLGSLGQKFAEKDIKINNKFDQLSSSGQFSDSAFQINTFKFLGENGNITIDGQGVIYPEELQKKGEMFVSVKEEMGLFSAQLNKNFGVSDLPLKLSGIGFQLRPEIGYTLEKLSRLALNKHKDKLKEKAKDAINDQVKKEVEKAKDKILGPNGEKAKDLKKLLKGFF